MNTIQQINTNNNLSFKKLHKVTFSKNFNIKADKNCANAYKAFKKSYTFKRFFDSYDVVAEFSSNKKDKTGFLNFYFSKIKEKTNKTKENLKNKLDINSFKLVNIIATYDYSTMNSLIDKMDFDNLIDKTNKKSKKLNFIEYENLKEIINNIEDEKKENLVQEENINIPINSISDLSKTLVKKTSNIIEENWTKLRKEHKNIHTLEFKDKIKNKNVLLKPIYINNTKFILLEIDSGNELSRIQVNSKTFDYKYEKIKKTEFGSAVIKSIDSKIKKDVENIQFVSEILETYLPKINKKNEIKFIDF